MRNVFILCLCILCSVVVSLSKLKFYVQNMQGYLLEIQRDIKKVNHEIGVLKAEWTYLNRPDRLTVLAARYLHRDSRVVLANQIKIGSIY